MDLMELLKLLEMYMEKKNACFEKIYELSEFQRTLMEADSDVLEAFNLNLDHKEECLRTLLDIDKDLDEVLKCHGHLLQFNLELYPEKVDMIKDKAKKSEVWVQKISEIEKQNKRYVEAFLFNKRNDVKAFRNSQSAVNSYTQNMPNMHQNYQSYFLDKKK